DPVSLFTNWTGRFPFYPPAFSALGVGLIDAGDPAAAIEPLRRAVAITDRSVEGHLNLGVALALSGQDRRTLEEALAAARRALELVPDAVRARASAGRLLLLLDRPAEAEGEARAGLLVSASDATLRLILAEALERQARHDESAAVFASLASAYPADPKLRSPYVTALILSGALARARAEIDKARRDFPSLTWFDFDLARIEARTGHREEALALLGISLSGDPAT